MSWDGYITNLTASGALEKAAICGIDGNVWAASPGFNLSPQEVQTIISGFTNKDVLSANGIRLGGEKFFYLQSDDCQIQGKKGAGGVSIAKSQKCVLIGAYKEGMQPGSARKTCEAMRDYLTSVNY